MCDRLKPTTHQTEEVEDQVDQEKQEAKWSQSEKYLHDSGCYNANHLLNECLVKHDRAWRECQSETASLKECMAQMMKVKETG